MNPLLEFAILSIGFAYKPGPGMLLFVTKTISDGYRAALIMAVGTELGHLLCFLGVAIGYAYLDRLGGAIALLTIIGGLFLVYTGLMSLLSTAQATGDLATVPSVPTNRVHGVLMSFASKFSANQGLMLLIAGFLWAFVNPVNVAFYVSVLPAVINVGELKADFIIYASIILVVSVFSFHLTFITLARRIRRASLVGPTWVLARVIGSAIFLLIGVYILYRGFNAAWAHFV